MHGHKFLDEELELLQKIKDAAGDPDIDDDELDDLMLQLSVRLIKHGDKQRRSGIMHFAAVLGIKEDTSDFHSSETCNLASGRNRLLHAIDHVEACFAHEGDQKTSSESTRHQGPSQMIGRRRTKSLL